MTNVANSNGRFITVSVNAPTSSLATGPVATWLGRTPVTTMPLPLVPGHLCSGQAQGMFLPNSDGVQRINPRRGTLDVWANAPAAGTAMQLCMIGNADTTFTGSDLGLIRVGVASNNRLTGAVRNSAGANVALFADATVGALVAGQLYHIQLSWDADLGVVSASLNGVAIPGSAYSTAPGGAWTPPTLDRFVLHKGSGTTQWNADIYLAQISSKFLL